MADLIVKLVLTADGRVLVQRAGEAEQAIARIGTTSQKAGQQSKESFASLGNLLKGIGAIALVRELGQLADQYKEINGRLLLAAGSGERYVAAQREVLEISQRTRAQLGATAELYTKMQRAVDQLGESQQTALQVTELVNKTFAISGANAAASAAAITQFAQGLSAGALRGDEFNSVMEQAPRLAQAIADSLHITTGELRAQAEQGKLTSDIIIKALTSQKDKIDAEFKAVPLTIAGAFTQVKNAVLVSVGEIDAAIGASGKIAAGIAGLADLIRTFTREVVNAGAVWIQAFSEWQEVFPETAGALDEVRNVLSDMIGHLKEVMADVVREFLILPQTLRTAFTIILGEGDKLRIGLIEKFQLLVPGIEGIWLDVKEGAARLALEIERLIGKAIDAVLSKYASLIGGVSSLAQKLGADETATKLQGVAQAVLANATAEDTIKKKIEETTQAYDARRAALAGDVDAIVKRSAAERLSANQAIQASLAERDAALKRLDVAKQVTSADEKHGKVSKAAAEATKEQARARRELTDGERAYLDVQKQVLAAVDELDRLNTSLDEHMAQQRDRLAGLSDEQIRYNAQLREANQLAMEALALGPLTEEQFSAYQSALAKIAQSRDIDTAVENQQRLADAARESARESSRAWEQFTVGLADAIAGGANGVRQWWKAMLEDMKRQLLQSGLLALVRGLFGAAAGGSTFGSTGSLASLFLGAGSGGGSFTGSLVSSGSQAVFGGGSGGAGLFSPSNWLSAGRSLWSGFSTMWAGSGQMTTLGSYLGTANFGPGMATTYTPSAFGTTLGLAGAAYGAYQGYRGAGGGTAGVAAGAAYGLGTLTAAGAIGGIATGAGAAAGAAGALGTVGLGAIPVVGWIALAAMLIDKFSGGKLFGTGYQTKSSTVSLGIGPDGGDATASLYQEGQKSLFRGKKRRTKDVDPGDDAIEAAQALFDSIKKTMTDSARALQIDVPPVIEGAIRLVNEYDKKGKVKSTKTFVDILGKQYEEASQELAATRLAAEAIVATVAASEAGKAASTIAEQWRDSAETLMAGAQFVLAATIDIQKGKGLLGDGATLEDTVAITQELAIGNEALTDTYARLAAETQLVEDAMQAMGVSIGKTGADLVRFADAFVQAAGGVQQAQQLWQQFFANYGADALAVTQQLTTLQQEAAKQLEAIGLDGVSTMDAFKAAFKAALPTLSADDIVTWIAAGNALADATHAQEAYTAAVKSYEDFSRDLAKVVSGYADNGNFTRQMAEIDAWRTDAIKQANDLAHAAGLAAAREGDLANIELRAAQLRAQAVRELESSTRDLVGRLYGGTGGSLDTINAQIAALESAQQGASQAAQDVANASRQRYEDELAAIERIRGFVKSLLLNTQLTTLTPEQQLAEARKQYEDVLARARAGDAAALSQLPEAAQAYLERGRGYYSSGDQYQAIFDSVTQALNALGAHTPAAPGGSAGGSVTITASADLQALYTQRDALLADQERQTRLAMAQQLAVQLQQLAAQTGQPVLEMAQSLGVKIDQFVSDLGINLQDLTVETAGQLADLASTLGISVDDLAQSVGYSLGQLADQNSLINQLLGQRIQALPATEKALLEPLFNALRNATTSTDANKAINDLRNATEGLPEEYRDLLAPLLGLPPTPTKNLADTATSAQKISDQLLSLPGNSIGAVVGYMRLAQIDDYTRYTVPVASGITRMKQLMEQQWGAGANGSDGGIDNVALNGDGAYAFAPVVNVAPAPSPSDDVVAELRQLRTQVEALRKERRDGDQQIVAAASGITSAVSVSGAESARTLQRAVERMGRS